MRAHRLALAELYRLTSGKLLRLALVALLIVPTLYAGLYLWANKDPYAHLDRVPAAIVVEDAGTTLSTGERLAVGDQVAKRLVDSRSLDWHRVSRAEATEGVRDDTYAFALVVPTTFSADIASSGSSRPRQARLEEITNDANGYLSRTIAGNVVAQVTKSVAAEVSSTAASRSLEGFATIHASLTKAVDGAAKLESGLARLDTGAASLSKGSSDLLAGQQRLADGAQQLADGAGTAATGARSLSSGASTLATGLGTLDSATAALPTQTQQLADGARAVADGTSRLSDGAGRLASGAQAADSGAARLQTGASRLTDGARQVAAGAHQVADGNAQVDAAGRQAAQAVTDLRAARTRNVARITAQVDDLERLNASLPTPDPRVGATVAGLRAQLTDLNTRLDGVDAQVTGASQRLTRLAEGSRQVADGADRLVTGASQLSTGLGTLRTGTAALRTGAEQLSTGAQQASAGAGRVADGAGRLAAGSVRLHDGIVSAHGGATRLADGASSLAGGVDRLATGARTLADGERTAVDGTRKLSGGAAELAASVHTAHTGATSLHQGLAKGLDQVPNPSPAQRRAAAEVVGNPVAIAAASQATAGSYGAGMAPFFAGLALWIGAYVLFLVVRPLSSRALAAEQPAWRVALSGWMTPALLAVGQSVLVLFVAIKGQGFAVQHLPAMLLFMAFVSCVYTAILHLLASRLGAVGKFLGLVLLVVQLVSAGGTFPWQTLPGPLRAVHHVVPMTYAIDGMRHLMYGGRAAIVWRDVAVLALFLGVAYALATLAARRVRTWTPTRVKPDLVL